MTEGKSVSKGSSSIPPLPAPLQFAAGGIAGVTEILVMYPLDGIFNLNNYKLSRLDSNFKLEKEQALMHIHLF